jgi:hypothetical protein
VRYINVCREGHPLNCTRYIHIYFNIYIYLFIYLYLKIFIYSFIHADIFNHNIYILYYIHFLLYIILYIYVQITSCIERERDIYIYLGIPVVFICTLFAGNRPARQVSKWSVVLFL